MQRRLQIMAIATLISGMPLSAQKMGPVLPARGDNPDCTASAPGSDVLTICGKRDPGDRYRIPDELRGTGQIDSRNMARDALERDSRSMGDGSETVGAFGAQQRMRQVRCKWLAERQIAQGRQIDCTRKPRRDNAGDWKGDRR